jgi:hypothetical protein
VRCGNSPYTGHSYSIAAQMKKAFAERNIAKERAQWLFNYDPLKVPLEDEDPPL